MGGGGGEVRGKNSNFIFWKSIVGLRHFMDFPVFASTFAVVSMAADGSDDTQQSPT